MHCKWRKLGEEFETESSKEAMEYKSVVGGATFHDQLLGGRTLANFFRTGFVLPSLSRHTTFLFFKLFSYFSQGDCLVSFSLYIPHNIPTLFLSPMCHCHYSYLSILKCSIQIVFRSLKTKTKKQKTSQNHFLKKHFFYVGEFSPLRRLYLPLLFHH